MPGIRLEWDGKAAEVPQLRLPLQVVETANAARTDRDPGDGWRNKLIWNQHHTPYEDWYVEQYYRYRDPDGRRFISN